MKLKTYKALAGSASVVALSAAGALLLSTQIASAEVCALYVDPNTVTDGGAVAPVNSLACGVAASATGIETVAVGASAVANAEGAIAIGSGTGAGDQTRA
jgi:putative exporter of polyketide antibiotics